MKLFIYVGFFLIFITNPSRAEPSASIEWLMGEPASLFDIGMMRMRIANKEKWTPKLMEEIQGEKLKLGDSGLGSVLYNWDENKITIRVLLRGEPTENMCKSVLNKYKKIISPFPEGSEYSYAFITHYFQHISYTKQSRPKDLGRNISKLLLFTVGISEKVGGKGIYCSSPLGSYVPSIQKFGF
jgi:hypothetical protein